MLIRSKYTYKCACVKPDLTFLTSDSLYELNLNHIPYSIAYQ